MIKRVLAGLLCVLLAVALLPKTARAAATQLDVGQGGIEFGATVTGKNSNGTSVNETYNPDGYIITGTTTSNTISVQTTQPVKITLNGVNINIPEATNACALDLMVGAHVTLTLADGSINTLSSGSSSAGIHVPVSATLIIQGGIQGDGTLNATAKDPCAGIGGNNASSDRNCGTVTINSGIVNATGGSSNATGGAGIGGGGAGGNETGGSGGTITINGGKVEAIGRGNGAGIGGGGAENGGTGGSGGTITINGGTVEARGANLGAGIGGGGASQLVGGTPTGTGGDGGAIIINGGKVSAWNGYSSSYGANQYGAAIGGGASPDRGRNTVAGSVNLSRYAQYEWAHTDTHTLSMAFTSAPYPDVQYPNGLRNAPGYTVIRPASGGLDGIPGGVSADIPRTGDDTPLALLCGLVLLCGAGFMVRTRKRKA